MLPCQDSRRVPRFVGYAVAAGAHRSYSTIRKGVAGPVGIPTVDEVEGVPELRALDQGPQQVQPRGSIAVGESPRDRPLGRIRNPPLARDPGHQSDPFSAAAFAA